MATANFELKEGFVLQQDLYKDKTLLLKKGVILNAYLMNKLSNFGIQLSDLSPKNEDFTDKSYTNNIEKEQILFFEPDELAAKRMQKLLLSLGFETENIAFVKNINQVVMKNTNISYLFVPSYLYNDNLISKLLLSNNRIKINVFVLNCQLQKPSKIFYNTDFLNVKFLYRPISKEYIEALFKMYS